MSDPRIEIAKRLSEASSAIGFARGVLEAIPEFVKLKKHQIDAIRQAAEGLDEINLMGLVAFPASAVGEEK